MKKISTLALISALIIITAMIMTSCFTTSASGVAKRTTVYDPTVPEEQMATLVIPEHYTVKTFDGEWVQWKPLSIFHPFAIIKIPVGEHTIVYNFNKTTTKQSESKELSLGGGVNKRTTTTTSRQNFDNEVTVTFQAGQKYQIFERHIGQYEYVYGVPKNF